MGISVYHRINPALAGLAAQLIGAGAKQQQYDEMEYEQQSRQNEMLGGGLGRGVGELFSTIAKNQFAEVTSERDLRHTLTKQDNAGDIARRNALDFEEAQTSGNIRQAREAMNLKRFGGTSDDLMAMFREQALYGSDETMVEPPPPIAGAPSGGGSPTPVNVTEVPDRWEKRYGPDAINKISLLRQAEQEIQHWPPEDQAKGYALLARERAGIGKSFFPAAPPPTTIDQRFGDGTIKEVRGGYIAYDEKGSPHFLQNRYAGSPEGEPEYTVQLPDGTNKKLGAGAYMFPMPNGGMVGVSIDPDGKSTINKLDTGGAGDGLDLKDFYTAQKALTVEDKVPDNDTTVKSLIEARKGVMQANEEIKREPARKALLARSDELLAMARRDELGVPMVEQWKQNAVQTYGNNFDAWPQEVQQAWSHLANEAAPLYRSRLTVAP